MIKRKLINMLLIWFLSFENGSMNNLRSDKDVTERLRCAAKKDYESKNEYKRLPEHRYVIEYKRFPELRYSFGIGKRAGFEDTAKMKRSMPYEFGIGKRNELKLLTDYLTGKNVNNYRQNQLIEEMDEKRAGGLMKNYDFGIGKRNNLYSSSLNLQSDSDFIDEKLQQQQQFNQDLFNNKLSNDDQLIWEKY